MQSLRSRRIQVAFPQKITQKEIDRIQLKAPEKMDEAIHMFEQLLDNLIRVLT